MQNRNKNPIYQRRAKLGKQVNTAHIRGKKEARTRTPSSKSPFPPHSISTRRRRTRRHSFKSTHYLSHLPLPWTNISRCINLLLIFSFAHILHTTLHAIHTHLTVFLRTRIQWSMLLGGHLRLPLHFGFVFPIPISLANFPLYTLPPPFRHRILIYHPKSPSRHRKHNLHNPLLHCPLNIPFLALPSTSPFSPIRRILIPILPPLSPS